MNDLCEPQVDDFRRKNLRRDGELLVDAFRRQAERDQISGPTGALGAGLAAEEIAIRLKHLTFSILQAAHASCKSALVAS
jgi:hypothetical protein